MESESDGILGWIYLDLLIFIPGQISSKAFPIVNRPFFVPNIPSLFSNLAVKSIDALSMFVGEGGGVIWNLQKLHSRYPEVPQATPGSFGVHVFYSSIQLEGASNSSHS